MAKKNRMQGGPDSPHKMLEAARLAELHEESLRQWEQEAVESSQEMWNDDCRSLALAVHAWGKSPKDASKRDLFANAILILASDDMGLERLVKEANEEGNRNCERELAHGTLKREVEKPTRRYCLEICQITKLILSAIAGANQQDLLKNIAGLSGHSQEIVSAIDFVILELGGYVPSNHLPQYPQPKPLEVIADNETPESVKPAGDDPQPEAKSESGSVLLFGRLDNPIVKGKSKKPLTTAQYDVMLALLEAGDKGLSKDRLDRESQRGDARKILKRIAKKDSDWESVISFPGKSGIGYRIL